MNNPRNVLIIDDDPCTLTALKDYLEDSGYTVFPAADGEEGVQLFERLQPDIVLTDLRMPKLDGFGVITAVKAQSPATPIIVFTGTGEHHVTNDVVRLGAWCCLYKPLDDMSNLVAAIEMALAWPKDGTTP